VIPHNFFCGAKFSFELIPAADNIARNFAGEWRFHINWNVISQVKLK